MAPVVGPVRAPPPGEDFEEDAPRVGHPHGPLLAHLVRHMGLAEWRSAAAARMRIQLAARNQEEAANPIQGGGNITHWLEQLLRDEMHPHRWMRAGDERREIPIQGAGRGRKDPARRGGNQARARFRRRMAGLGSSSSEDDPSLSL